LLQIPHQYRNLNRHTKEKNEEQHQKLINELIARDEFEDIATLKVSVQLHMKKRLEMFIAM
jgi:negative regulator of genetic competence, sporulation and motility